MRQLNPLQLTQISGGCDRWYHFAYCSDTGATQAEFEMEYGSRASPTQDERHNVIPLS